MKSNTSEFLWVERYRPQTVAECVLPARMKQTFTEIIEKGQLHNMLFTGTAGLGKTTLAKALCNELGCDWILVNASEDCGIDVLRQRIKQFASTTSLSGSGGPPKVVILDEADYLSSAVQAALRGFMEEFSKNCRFILTCNFKNRIIEAIHSRSSVVDFTTSKAEKATLIKEFFRRMSEILTQENVKFDKKLLAEVVMRYAPDWRRVIGECQRHSSSGELAAVVLCGSQSEIGAELAGYLRSKDFKSMRAWAVNNTDIEPSVVFRSIYDSLSEYAVPASIPQAVLILAEYSYKAAFVADREINVVACMTELMVNIDWV